MARPPKVWFNEQRKAFCINLNGKQVKLLAGERNEENRLEAIKVWHSIAGRSEAQKLRDHNADRIRFEYLAFAYLGYIEEKHPSSLKGYKGILRRFSEAHPTLVASEVSVRIVKEWLETQKTWSESSKGRAVNVIYSCLNWGYSAEQGFLTRNPIHGIKRPKIASRAGKCRITDEQFEQLLAVCPPWLADVLNFLKETGRRLIDVCRIEAKDIHGNLIVLAEHKTAEKTGKPLFVPLPPTALEIVQRLTAINPEGKIFRSPYGRPLTTKTIVLAIARRRDAIGLPKSITGYSFRHTLITRMRESGATKEEAAEFVGHVNTEQMKNYDGSLMNVQRMIELAERSKDKKYSEGGWLHLVG